MASTKIYVDAVSVRLTEDKDFVSSGQYAINRYMQDGKNNIKPSLKGVSLGETLVEAVSGSLVTKMKRVYTHASTPGNYVYGIPTSYLGAPIIPEEGGEVIPPPEGEIPPEIDDDFEYGDDIDYAVDTGLYFPRLYTRVDAVNIYKKSKDSVQRKDSEKIFKLLGLKLDEVTDSFNEGIGEVNGDFKHIILNMGISINRDLQDNITGKYLYDYFNRLYTKGTPIESLPENIQYGVGRTGMIQRIKDNVYTQQLEYDSIWKRSDYGVGVRPDGSNLEVGEYEVFSRDRDILTPNIHYIRYQRTADTLDNIIIIELTLRYLFSNQVVVMDGTNENLNIPLDYAVAYSMVSTTREKLISKSMHLTVITLKEVKKKWYERKYFKFVVAVVSVAMNFVVPGSGLTLAALFQAVATSILIGIVIDVAIGILIKIAIRLGISEEIILILAIAATAYFSSYGKGGTDYSKLFNAKEAMKIFNQAFDAYGKAIQETIKNIQKEMNTFLEYSKSKTEQLAEAQKLLTTGVVSPDLELLASPTSSIADLYLGETPEEFYTRTMMTDVTSLTLDMVNLFLEATTSLPKARSYRPRSLDEMDDVLLIS